jgi:hypothetical protein
MGKQVDEARKAEQSASDAYSGAQKANETLAEQAGKVYLADRARAAAAGPVAATLKLSTKPYVAALNAFHTCPKPSTRKGNRVEQAAAYIVERAHLKAAVSELRPQFEAAREANRQAVAQENTEKRARLEAARTTQRERDKPVRAARVILTAAQAHLEAKRDGMFEVWEGKWPVLPFCHNIMS